MGHRANLVVVDDEPEVYYSHWAGHDLSNHVVLGAPYTLRFVRQQERGTAPDDWLEGFLADGGLAMDVRRRRVVWWDLPTEQDLARFRLVHALMARTWPGWGIVWAHHEMVDLRAAAGDEHCLERHRLVADPFDAPFPGPEPLNDPVGSWWARLGSAQLLTVRRSGAVVARLVSWHRHLGWSGLARLQVAERTPGGVLGDRALRLSSPPTGGLHVDLDDGEVRWWSITPIPRLAEAMPELWPGMRVRDLGDRFEEHWPMTLDPELSGPADRDGAAAAFARSFLDTHGPQAVHLGVQAVDAMEKITIFGAPLLPRPIVMDHHTPAPSMSELRTLDAHLTDLVGPTAPSLLVAEP